jgi:transposase
MPAKYVRPYSKGQKNDFNDAEAIAEAVQRPTMKFVATKTAEQLDLQALHRVRERLVSQRTGIINQIRAFMLERGIAVRQGIGFLRTELPTILATRTDALSPRMLCVIEELAGDWRRLDQRIDRLSGEIEALARQDQACSRLMTVSGIGPIISSAMVAAIGTGDVFSKGRDFGAWLLTGTQADLNRRPHDPRKNLEAWQSLPARSVRAGGMGGAGQDQELGTLRTQILDRSRQEAIAPQRASDRTRQQACPHRLGGAG